MVRAVFSIVHPNPGSEHSNARTRLRHAIASLFSVSVDTVTILRVSEIQWQTTRTKAHPLSSLSKVDIQVYPVERSVAENIVTELNGGAVSSALTDVGVVVTGAAKMESTAVRLGGGKTSTEGRVEVFMDGQWGAVCNNDKDRGATWGKEETSVICRQFNLYPADEHEDPPQIASGSVPGLITGVRCFGHEDTLQQCAFNLHDKIDNCDQVTLACRPPPVRLVGGKYSWEGRLEVWISTAGWGSACVDNGWDNTASEVVCKQLGFVDVNGVLLASNEESESMSQEYVMFNVHCVSSSPALQDCLFSPTSDSQCQDGPVHVICKPTDECGCTAPVCQEAICVSYTHPNGEGGCVFEHWDADPKCRGRCVDGACVSYDDDNDGDDDGSAVGWIVGFVLALVFCCCCTLAVCVLVAVFIVKPRRAGKLKPFQDDQATAV